MTTLLSVVFVLIVLLAVGGVVVILSDLEG